MTVPVDDLPGWLPAWCLDHLGNGPADVLFQLHQVSMVFGLRLPGGTDVVGVGSLAVHAEEFRPAARCCTGIRRTWPRAARRCSPG